MAKPQRQVMVPYDVYHKATMQQATLLANGRRVPLWKLMTQQEPPEQKEWRFRL